MLAVEDDARTQSFLPGQIGGQIFLAEVTPKGLEGGRPPSEKPVILRVVGYPEAGCQVPVHGGIKKPLDQIAAWL